MEKIYGATERYDGIQQIGRRRWEIFYGYGTEGDTAYQYRQTLEHKPSHAEIKELILTQINTIVRERILTGLEYQERLVWLSAENQRNIAFAYALAKGGDLTTPPTLKLGTDNDYILYTFDNAEEVIAFAILVQEHIERCIEDGRQEKASVDWSCYEEIMKEAEE